MAQTQHGYLYNIAVSGQVTCFLEASGEVKVLGEVQLIHPQQQDTLPHVQPLLYTGTCRDAQGGFHYVSLPVFLQSTDPHHLVFEGVLVWESSMTG